MISLPHELIIIGSGGAAAEVTSYINDINASGGYHYHIRGYLDSSNERFASNSKKYRFTAPLLGDPADFVFSDEYSYVVAFANPVAKRELVTKIQAFDVLFPNIIHPTSIISESANFGCGNIISPHCVIGPACVIGDFNLFTSYGFVSHDCVVGSYNFLSTAGISGGAVIGDCNFLGVRSTILPNINVGSNCVIQAGMIVDKDVESGSTIYYRFKEKIYYIKA